ncbi:hypothetical protein BV25DRAFT_621126 [Artomyces pyxidatus]|uniref:Uncharacterized protein n=1 Tax=Artomyces pyxidatus TaxID=48021 RepID=A0ACB8T3W7_9AGAM|nr:hypothetical protein BV25DRAFT_621126 [Artomyces pyxidatus]
MRFALRRLITLPEQLALVKKKKTVRLIPRPKGSSGSLTKGFSLIVAMGLADNEEDREMYGTMLRGIRDIALYAKIDMSKTYTQQNAECLARLFKNARDTYPILGKYENNWATAAFVQQFINNRRKNNTRNQKKKGGLTRRKGKATIDELEDQEKSASPSSKNVGSSEEEDEDGEESDNSKSDVDKEDSDEEEPENAE